MVNLLPVFFPSQAVKPGGMLLKLLRPCPEFNQKKRIDS